jgi:hypothetical protein
MKWVFPGCCLLFFLWSSPAMSQDAAGSASQGPGAPVDPKAFHYSRTIPDSPEGLTALVLDAAVLAHSALDLSDVRIADAGDHQIPYLLEKRQDALTLTVPVIPDNGKARPKQSRYRLVLPFENLPDANLVLSTSERTFQRRISIEAMRAATNARTEPFPETLASANWIHDDPESATPALTLALHSSLNTNWIALIVDEGDNHLLAVSGARIELPLYRLRFFYPANGKLRLLYGQPGLSAPRYDLELLAARLAALSSRELNLEPESLKSPVPEKSSFQTRVFWGALVVAVLVVLGLLVRLLRPDPAGSGKRT